MNYKLDVIEDNGRLMLSVQDEDGNILITVPQTRKQLAEFREEVLEAL